MKEQQKMKRATRMLMVLVMMPLIALATSLSDGLVAHYKFDGNANDYSGNGNHGVVHGAILTTDRSGTENSAYKFDGDDWIAVPHSTSLADWSNGLTISVWLKPQEWYASSFGKWIPIVCKADYGYREGTFRCQIGEADGGSSYQLRGEVVGTGDDAITLGEWQMVSMVFTGDTVLAYKNGHLIGMSTADSISSQNDVLEIGRDIVGGTEYLNGSMDDLRIYNRVLSSEEISSLYDQDGLVAYFKFDGNANDLSGNRNDGVVHGAVLTTDRFGRADSAYSFDGDDWIAVPHSTSLADWSNGLTISVWLKPQEWYASSFGKWIPIVCKADYGYREGTFRCQIGEADGGSSYQLRGEVVGTGDDAITLGEWQMVSMVCDGERLSVYKNGNLVGTAPADSITSQADMLEIGRDIVGGTEYMKGCMDDLRIYNRALTASEVSSIYNEGSDPITYRTVTFNANGGECAKASAAIANGSTVGTLPIATCDGYSFLGWFTSPSGGTQISETTVVTADVTWYAHWQEQDIEPTFYTVQFNANGGSCARTSVEVEDGVAVGTLPTPTRDGYDFLGWFTAATGGTQVSASTVVTADITWFAHWQEQVVDPVVPPVDPSEDDEPMDASIANTYDGVIVDADGLPMGYINVKTARATGKGDTKVSKVTATIQMIGEAKKVTVKANVLVSEATMTQATADGRVLDLVFSRYGFWGTFDGYEIEGVRNLLISTAKSDKGTEAKAAADAVYAALVGNYVMAYQDDNGWNGLSITVMTKGKVRVSGKLANSTSVATTSQLIVGSDYSVIPIIYTKKDTSLAFNIYFSNDGAEAEVFGYYDAVISSVGGLTSGLSFYLGDEVYDLFGESYSLCDQFLPYGLSVEPVSASKWSVANGAKAGSIKLKDGEVLDTKESENPSGLKLTFNSRAGTFSGSFKVYALDSKDKLKTFTATISGVVIDGIGYGTATIKKIGSCAVVIAE